MGAIWGNLSQSEWTVRKRLITAFALLIAAITSVNDCARADARERFSLKREGKAELQPAYYKGLISPFAKEALFSINKSVSLSMRGFGYRHQLNAAAGAIAYDAEFHLAAPSAILDFRPIASGPFLASGIFYSASQFWTRGQAHDPTLVDNADYAPHKIGTQVANLDMSTFSPFIGMGWSPPTKNSRFRFRMTAGALMRGRVTDAREEANRAFLFGVNLASPQHGASDIGNAMRIGPLISVSFSHEF
ncbi:MAG: hypothetical protein AAGF15_05910 [Pseudomonadota bacterium]